MRNERGKSDRCLLTGIAGGMFVVVGGLTGCDTLQLTMKDILSTPSSPIASSSAKPEKPSQFASLEAAVHAQINQYRASKNLPPLKLDPRISQQARLHSDAMASRKATFSHDGFEKRVDAIAKSISYRSAAENLAYNEGFKDPVGQAVKGWLESPGHYKNIVGDFDLTGIGVVKTPQGRYYLTQIFIKKANALGF
jgi:uncharacterized protein YkwD